MCSEMDQYKRSSVSQCEKVLVQNDSCIHKETTDSCTKPACSQSSHDSLCENPDRTGPVCIHDCYHGTEDGNNLEQSAPKPKILEAQEGLLAQRDSGTIGDSNSTRDHIEALDNLEAGDPSREQYAYHEEEAEDIKPLPGNNDLAWGYHGHRRRRPTPRADWIEEADELESAVGSATGTRYYFTA